MSEKKIKIPKENTMIFQRNKAIKEFGLFSREMVIELLKRQIADCSDSIQADNLSEYTAKRKILETKPIDF